MDTIRDIFGNPFRPVAFDPAWRTEAAVGIAQAAYDSRAFGNLPVLADALQDAGCEHPDVLAHLRGPINASMARRMGSDSVGHAANTRARSASSLHPALHPFPSDDVTCCPAMTLRCVSDGLSIRRLRVRVPSPSLVTDADRTCLEATRAV